MTSIEIIRLVGTEFAGVTDEDLGRWIEIVKPLVSKKRFGKLYEQAIAYLVCHKMKMAGFGAADASSEGTSGGILPPISETTRINSMSEGETSISFGSSQQSNIAPDAEYGLTSYGMQYLSLRRLVIVPITCSGEGMEL